MHVILGAGGPIANALTNLLIADEKPVRLVSRQPVSNPSELVTWQHADLLNLAEVQAATRDATIIYLCAGLQYATKVWQAQWPPIIDNVIAATQAADARLLFFDNIYMYGLVDGPITETTPYRPVSGKGRVRAQIADTLMTAIGKGLRATIARAPDFYGATSVNSLLDSMVINKFAAGDRAMWIGKTEKLHNFIYVPDAARGLYTLAQHSESDGQVWHLPTPPPISGHAMLELVADVYGVPEKHFAMNKLVLRAAGLFSPLVRESVEMYYQYDHDYHFDSGKFERAFSVTPTPYREGLQAIRKQR